MNKLLLLLLSSLLILSSCENKPKPDGRLEGVATYFFNDNYGDKPDVGAKVIVCNVKDLRPGVIDSLQLFIAAKSHINQIHFYEEMEKSYKELGLNKYKEDIEGFKKKVEEEKGNLIQRTKLSEGEFEKLKNELTLLTIEFSIHKTQEVVCDGSGKYEISLSPGEYYLLIQSNHRKNYTTGEIFGILDMDDVNIKSSQTVSKNFNFSLSDSN